ncbi:MAG: winged helix DNA-binding domain-containing protein, partial [Clostridiales bacterium]|nr:winged helix DNA-binding domain-containing protein [Clostridiales bacterium]
MLTARCESPGGFYKNGARRRRGTASEEKAFRLCPPFVPMAREDALQEQLRRYLASFGPVSLRDAAYF